MLVERLERAYRNKHIVVTRKLRNILTFMSFGTSSLSNSYMLLQFFIMYSRTHFLKYISHPKHSLPLVGQVKQSRELNVESFHDFEPQGLSDLLYRYVTSQSKEIRALASTLDFFQATKDMFVSWFEVIRKWVCKTYLAVTNLFQQWSITLAVAIESIKEAFVKGHLKVTDFFSALFTAGAPSTPEQEDIITSISADSQAHVDKEHPEEEEGLKPQSGFIDLLKKAPEAVNSFIIAIATPLLFLLGEYIPSCGKACKSFYSLTSMFSSLDRLDLVSKGRRLVNFIYHSITGKDLWIEFEIASAYSEARQELTMAIDALESCANPPYKLQKRVYDHFHKLTMLYPKMLEADAKSVNQTSKIYEALKARAAPWANSLKGSERIKPVVCVLSGESCTGKTWTQTSLIEHIPQVLYNLVRTTSIQEDIPVYAMHAAKPSKFSVNCMGEKSQFDDGYMDPFFYCFEEYQTSKNAKIKSAWSEHFMKCIDDQPYMLNMAFGDKGKRYFNSPFVFATGNFKNHHHDIEDPTAYHRRIELDMTVTRGYIPPGATYDPKKHAVYSFTTDALKILMNPGLCPSLWLHNVTKGRLNKYCYNTVLYFLVGIYMERICKDRILADSNPIDLVELVTKQLETSVKPNMRRKRAVFWNSMVKNMKETTGDDVLEYLDIVNAEEPAVEPRSTTLRDSLLVIANAMDKCAEAVAKSQEDFQKFITPEPEIPKVKSNEKEKDKEIVLQNFLSNVDVNSPHLPEGDFDREEYECELYSGCTTSSSSSVEEFSLGEDTEVQIGKPQSMPALPNTLENRPALSRRADAIYSLYQFFLAKRSRSMYAYPSSLWSSLDNGMPREAFQELGWKPIDDAVEGLRGNPFYYYSVFDVSVSRARASLKGFVLPESRANLSSSLWSNIKRNFCAIYPAFYYAKYWCDMKRKMFANMADKDLATYCWVPTVGIMSPQQQKDISMDYKRTLNSDGTAKASTISVRGNVMALPRPEQAKYRQRVYENKKRNGTKPPREQGEKKAVFVPARLQKAKDTQRSKAGAMRRREQRNVKLEPQGGFCDLNARYPAMNKLAYPAGSALMVKMRAALPSFRWFTLYSQKVETFRTNKTLNSQDKALLMLAAAYPVSVEVDITAVIMSRMLNDFASFSSKIEKVLDMLESHAFKAPSSEGVLSRVMSVMRCVEHDDVDSYVERVRIADMMLHGVARYPRIPSLLTNEFKKGCWAIANDFDQIFGGYVKINATKAEFEYMSYTDDLTSLKDSSVSDEGFVSFDFKLAFPVVMLVSFGISSLIMLVVGYTRKQKTQESFDGVPEDVKEEVVTLAHKLSPYGLNLMVATNQSGERGLPQVEGSKKDVLQVLQARGLAIQGGVKSGVAAKFDRNKYAILYDGRLVGNLTFLEGGVAMMNAHVWRALPNSFLVVPYVHVANAAIYNIQKSRCTVLCDNPDKDLAVVVIPGIRSHASLYKSFITLKELQNFDKESCAIISYFDQDEAKPDMAPIGDIKHVSKVCNIEAGRNSLSLSSYFIYKWPGAVKGACGSTPMATIMGATKCVGQHSAGNTRTQIGVCSVITREDVQIFCNSYKGVDRSPKLDAISAFDLIGLNDKSKDGVYDFEAQGYVTPINTLATDSTNFIPTPFQTLEFKGGCDRRPANLGFEAYQNALAKEDTFKDVINPDPMVHEIIEEFKEEMAQIFFGGAHLIPKGCKTLDVDEALFEHDNLIGFDKTTSKGMRCMMWGLDKRSILDRGSDYEKFIGHHRTRWEYMERGVFDRQVNFDKLKDELRDHDRVDAKKTRIFKITDFQDNVIIKQCIGDLVNKTKDLHWMTSSTCGVNPGDGEWRLIYNYFGDDRVCWSDISGFESTVTSLIYPFLWYIICLAYPNPKARVFAAYAVLSILNALRFNRGKGFLPGRGNTSGNWITTWLNTITNFVYFCCIVVYGSRLHGEDPVVNLRKLKLRLYSDDNLSSLPCSWYTPTFVRDAMKLLFNVKIVGLDKGEVSDELCSGHIGQGNFLSRGFRYERGQVFCPLNEDSLFAQIYYIRGPRGLVCTESYMCKQLQQNLDNVARELLEYPEDYAKARAREIREFIELHELPFHFMYLDGSDHVEVKLLKQ